MYVTMSMEEYQSLSEKAEKYQNIKRIAKGILVNHTGNDWSKIDDLNEAFTHDESVDILKAILNEGGN